MEREFMKLYKTDVFDQITERGFTSLLGMNVRSVKKPKKRLSKR